MIGVDERLVKMGDAIADKLDDLGSRCELHDIIIAPQLVRFEMIPATKTKIRNLARLAPELAYEVSAESIKILAPIPGRRAIGIEIPNPHRSPVMLSDLEWEQTSPLAFPVGVGVDGVSVVCELDRMPHLLIGGTTGAGKSSLLNSMLVSLLRTNTPDELGLVLIDTKRVELMPYAESPHLLHPVIDDPFSVDEVLMGLVDTMESRYEQLATQGCRDIAEHNAAIPEALWLRVLVVVDELADLMMVNKAEVEIAIARLAQKGRAAGVHLVLATQSPRVSVISGLIKSNIASRIALTCASQTDSRVVLDRGGAERLVGAGDSLYLPTGAPEPIRVQCPMVTLDEIREAVAH